MRQHFGTEPDATLPSTHATSGEGNCALEHRAGTDDSAQIDAYIAAYFRQGRDD